MSDNATLIDEAFSPSMAPTLHFAKALAPQSLDSGLARYLTDGLEVVDGRALIAARFRLQRGDIDCAFDMTAFETLVNKIHADDWYSEQLGSQSVEQKLAQVRILASQVADQAGRLGYSVTIYVTIGTRNDLVFRFHTDHAGEPAWTTDPVGLLEPVLRQTWRPTLT